MIRQRYRHRNGTLSVELQRATDGQFLANVDGEECLVEARLVNSSTMQIVIDGRARTAHVVRTGESYHIALNGEHYLLTRETGSADASGARVEPLSPQIIAPMPGKVLQVLVREGQEVADGDGLLVLEAMKMENRIVAEAAGIVRRVRVEEGQMVEGGTLLVEVEYFQADTEDPSS